MPSVEIYTKPSCPHCIQAKNLLTTKNIPFKEITVPAEASKEDIQAKIKALGSSAQVRTVPQIFYTNKQGEVIYIGGNSDLQARANILGT
jgi:glutaredoxin 3